MTRAEGRTGTRLAVGALAGVLLLAGCGASPENKVRDKIGDVTEAVNDYTDDRASAQDVLDALSSLDNSVTANATDLDAARVQAIMTASAKLRADVEKQEAADEQPSPEPSEEPSVEPPPPSEEPEESPEPEPSEEPEESPEPEPSEEPVKSPKPKPSPSKPAAAVSASPVAAGKPKASPARSAPSAAPTRAAAASRSPATPTAALTA